MNEMEDQYSLFDQDTPSMKMSEDSLLPTTVGTSKKSSWSSSKSSSRMPLRFLCLKKGDGHTQTQSMEWVPTGSPFPSHGGFMMPPSGEYPKEENGIVYLPISTGSLQPRYCLTLNLSECPREECPSHLIEILEPIADPKYRLSPKACQGILRRAERRGKELPPLLDIALKLQSAFRSEPENREEEKESSSSETE